MRSATVSTRSTASVSPRTEDMDVRAIACFDQAMEDIGIARDDRLWRALRDYFAWATNTTMARYHHSADDVPNGLRIPKWSWEGLGADYA